MSEWQYYEFRALDRPLTKKQMEILRRYSTRAEITTTSFTNEYNWGNFKGDPKEWIEKYFDAFVYLANWGSRWLMFRFPKATLNGKSVSRYCWGESLTYWTKGDHAFVSFSAEEVESDWHEEEDWLSSVVALRNDMMKGDYRCLYLGWLLDIQRGYVDENEPDLPVPPGLGDLSESLTALVEFLGIDCDLISVASGASKKGASTGLSDDHARRWLASIEPAEKDKILMQLLVGDQPHFRAEVQQRALRSLSCGGSSFGTEHAGTARTAGQLLELAERSRTDRLERDAQRRAEEQAKREQEKAARRESYLSSLVGKEEDLWTRIDQLISTKQPNKYDEAIALLKDLREVSDRTGRTKEFVQRVWALRDNHLKKTSMLKRMTQAGLVG